MSGYWNSPDLTFFSGAKKVSGWQPTLDRYRKNYQGEGHEMGKLEFSRAKRSDNWKRCRVRSRSLALNHVRRKNAARFVYAGIPQIS